MLQQFESKLAIDPKSRKIGRCKPDALSASQLELLTSTLSALGGVVSGNSKMQQAIASRSTHMSLIRFIGWPNGADGKVLLPLPTEAEVKYEAEFNCQIVGLQVLRELAYKYPSVVKDLRKEGTFSNITDFILWTCGAFGRHINMNRSFEDFKEAFQEETRMVEEFEAATGKEREVLTCFDGKTFQPHVTVFHACKHLDRVFLEVLFSMCLLPEQIPERKDTTTVYIPDTLDCNIAKSVLACFDLTQEGPNSAAAKFLIKAQAHPVEGDTPRVRFQLQQYSLRLLHKVLSIKPYLFAVVREYKPFQILFSDLFFLADKESRLGLAEIGSKMLLSIPAASSSPIVSLSSPLISSGSSMELEASGPPNSAALDRFLARMLKRQVLEFIAFASTCDDSPNLQECQHIMSLIQQNLDNDVLVMGLTRCLLAILRHRVSKTQDSLLTVDAVHSLTQLVAYHQKLDKLEKESKGVPRPNLLAVRLCVLRLLACMLSTEQLQIFALNNKGVVNVLFSLLRERQPVRHWGLKLVTSIMSVMGPKFSLDEQEAKGSAGDEVDGETSTRQTEPSSSRPEASSDRHAASQTSAASNSTLETLKKTKWALFSKYVELLPRVLTDDLSLALDLLQGIREVLKRHTRHHQDIFRRRQCFMQVINMLSYIVSVELVERPIVSSSDRRTSFTESTASQDPTRTPPMSPASVASPQGSANASFGFGTPAMKGISDSIGSTGSFADFSLTPVKGKENLPPQVDRNLGTSVCISVVQTLTALMAGNKKSQDLFRQNIGYDLLADLLLRAEQNKPSREVYASLFDMLVDGDFFIQLGPMSSLTSNCNLEKDGESSGKYLIKNPDVITMMFSRQLLLKAEHALQSEIFDAFTNIVAKSALNQSYCCRVNLIDALLDLFPSLPQNLPEQKEEQSLAKKTIDLIKLLGTHSISVKQLKRFFSLMKSRTLLRPGTEPGKTMPILVRPSYGPLLLDAIARMTEKEGPTNFFFFDGYALLYLYVELDFIGFV